MRRKPARQLRAHLKRVQEVAAEHHGVLGRVHGVDPRSGDEQRLAGAHSHLEDRVRPVAEKHLALVLALDPLFVRAEVRGARGHEQEDLDAADD